MFGDAARNTSAAAWRLTLAAPIYVIAWIVRATASDAHYVWRMMVASTGWIEQSNQSAIEVQQHQGDQPQQYQGATSPTGLAHRGGGWWA